MNSSFQADLNLGAAMDLAALASLERLDDLACRAPRDLLALQEGVDDPSALVRPMLDLCFWDTIDLEELHLNIQSAKALRDEALRERAIQGRAIEGHEGIQLAMTIALFRSMDSMAARRLAATLRPETVLPLWEALANTTEWKISPPLALEEALRLRLAFQFGGKTLAVLLRIGVPDLVHLHIHLALVNHRIGELQDGAAFYDPDYPWVGIAAALNSLPPSDDAVTLQRALDSGKS